MLKTIPTDQLPTAFIARPYLLAQPSDLGFQTCSQGSKTWHLSTEEGWYDLEFSQKKLSYKCFWGPKTFWWFNFKCFSPYMGINLLGLWFLTSYLWNFLELSLVVGFTLSFRCVRQQPRPPCHLGLPWFALLSLFRLGPAQSDIMVPGSACTHHPARLPPGRRDSAWRTRFPPTPTGANSPGASAIDTDDRNLKPNNIMTRYDNLMTTFTTMKWNSFIDWRSPTINYIRSVRLMAWTRTHAECLAKSSQCLQEIRRQYSPTADLQWSCLNPLGFTQRWTFSRAWLQWTHGSGSQWHRLACWSYW